LDWLRRAIAVRFGGGQSDHPVDDDERDRMRDANAANIGADASSMPMYVSGSPDDRDEPDSGDDGDGSGGGDGGGGGGGGGGD
jgi:hypothetical protein